MKKEKGKTKEAKTKTLQKFKQNKAITLIALIITIIVLLILAGVTISAITSNESAPNKAVEARKKNEQGAEFDAIKLSAMSSVAEGELNLYVDIPTLISGIQGYVKETNLDEIITGNGPWEVTGKSGIIYEITRRGEVTIKSGITLTPTAIELSDDTLTATLTATISEDLTGTINWSIPNGTESNGVISNDKISISASTGNSITVTKIAESGNTTITATLAGTTYTKDCAVTIKTVPLITSLIPGTNESVTAVSNDDNATIRDELGNKIKIPKGFGIAKDSGTKIEQGIVIEDATSASTAGSQFVWVPVGDFYKGTPESKTTEHVTLGRYTFQTSGTNAGAPTTDATKKQEQTGTAYVDGTVTLSNYYSENETESTARSLSDFVNSAIANKGYYIARYEAGLSGTTANNSLSTKTAITVKPLSISGKGVWNSIKQSDASTVSKNMYGIVTDNSEKRLFASDLVNSYAWDTAIAYINKCGANSNYANQGRLQSGSLATTGNATDGTNKDVQCKIYDMAGNVYEWTTEHSSNSSFPCVTRGGNYGDTYTASSRSNNSDDAYNNIGFRPLLYL